MQRRMKSDSRPKYRNAARAVLLNQITKLEAEKLALKEELEKVRAQQISQLDAFLNDTLDIRILKACGQALSAGADSVDELKLRRMTKATTVKR